MTRYKLTLLLCLAPFILVGQNNIKTPRLTADTANIANRFKLTSGASNGYVLKSDANGVGTWQYAATSYQGTWNANTNTPTLADGTGAAGDFYIVYVGDTANLGSGNIIFVTGGFVMYNGSIWEGIAPSQQVNSVNSLIGNVQLNLTQTADSIKLTGGGGIRKDTSKIYGTSGYIPKFTAAKTIGNSILKEVTGSLTFDTGAHRTFSIAANTVSGGNGYDLLLRGGNANLTGAAGGHTKITAGEGVTSGGNVYLYGGLAGSNVNGVYVGHNGSTFVGNAYAPNRAPSDSSYNIANTAFVHSITDTMQTSITPLRRDGVKAWIGDTSLIDAYSPFLSGRFMIVDTTGNNRAAFSVLNQKPTAGYLFGSVSRVSSSGSVDAAYSGYFVTETNDDTQGVWGLSNTVTSTGTSLSATGMQNNINAANTGTAFGHSNYINISGASSYVYGVHAQISAAASDSVFGFYSFISDPGSHSYTFMGRGGKLHNDGAINTNTQYEVNGQRMAVIRDTTVTLSSAQILTLWSGDITIIPSPGAGKMIEIISASMTWYAGTSGYTSANNIRLAVGSDMFQFNPNWGATNTTKYYRAMPTVNEEPSPDNGVGILVNLADPTGGNGTAKVYITYRIITL